MPPPSNDKTCPVIYAALSLARNTTASATFLGLSKPTERNAFGWVAHASVYHLLLSFRHIGRVMHICTNFLWTVFVCNTFQNQV